MHVIVLSFFLFAQNLSQIIYIGWLFLTLSNRLWSLTKLILSGATYSVIYFQLCSYLFIKSVAYCFLCLSFFTFSYFTSFSSMCLSFLVSQHNLFFFLSSFVQALLLKTWKINIPLILWWLSHNFSYFILLTLSFKTANQK